MVLKEAMKEMWLRGTKVKHWRLIYKMNSNNILTPITILGKCKEVKVKEMIKQGSILGAAISAMTIDSLTRIIENHGGSWQIGGIQIHPLLFQDDIFAVSKTENMQKLINKIEVFQNLKRLQFHEDKTKKSIINGKRDETLYINGIEIKRARSHKYLGKIIEEKGKIKEEIKKRMEKATTQAIQTMIVIKHQEMCHKRIEVGIRLLQTVIIPTLTFGAETWTKLNKGEKENMNRIQTQYLTNVLGVPPTTPICALLHETGLMKIEHIVNQRKLEYYVDLHNREDERLEVRIRKYQENERMTYETEIEELIKLYKIEENLKEIGKYEGKKIIKKAIEKKNKEEIDEQKNKGRKTQNLERWKEDYLRNLKYKDARTIFELRSNMIKVKANYKNEHAGQIKCELCKEKDETTQHIFECKENGNLLKEINVKESTEETLKINNLEKIAETTRMIMERRKEKIGKKVP